MSFERFSSSDVYIYEHVGGFIECCGCSISEIDEDGFFGFAKLATPREALAHLDAHEDAGEDIGGARRRIEKEYEGNLDKKIEPYVEDPEVAERRRARTKEIFMSKKNKNELPKTHSVDEVDVLTAESLVSGFSECHDVVAETQKEMLDAVNVVMGIYMTHDLGKYDDRVKELDLIHTVIKSFGEKFDENYFEQLDEMKDSLRIE